MLAATGRKGVAREHMEHEAIMQMLVSHSEMLGGRCVYTQEQHGEYSLVFGPFEYKADAHIAAQEGGGA
jgi:hypothetical protein